MRRAFLGLAVVLATACRDGKGPTAPPVNGTLNFQIETKTCAAESPFDIEVFIDHALVGTSTFNIGSTASYTVVGGSHTVGGFATDHRFNWGSVVVEVPAGGAYTALFACH
jgi:hypothetical protein